MAETSIEWTNATWNPVSGCARVSEGCRHCYAEGIAARFSKPGQPYHGLATMTESGPRWTGEVKLHPERLQIPLKWKTGRRVFTCSMSDLFHPKVPFDFIDHVFGVMAAAGHHTFQVLTKRPERMAEYVNGGVDRAARVYHFANRYATELELGREPWPLPNVWLGTSVEDQAAADERIPPLMRAEAAVRFLSCEPLLGPVDLSKWLDAQQMFRAIQLPGGAHTGLDWVIVGGESGPKARPMNMDWARSLRDQCRASKVAFFYKQSGSWAPDDQVAELKGRTREFFGVTYRRVKKSRGRMLDGEIIEEYPVVAG